MYTSVVSKQHGPLMKGIINLCSAHAKYMKGLQITLSLPELLNLLFRMDWKTRRSIKFENISCS